MAKKRPVKRKMRRICKYFGTKQKTADALLCSENYVYRLMTDRNPSPRMYRDINNLYEEVCAAKEKNWRKALKSEFFGGRKINEKN